MNHFLQILAEVDKNCGGLKVIVQFIKKGVFPIIQIGIPIILIIFGSIDLGKAVMSSDDKKIKEAQGMLIKRCIAAVAVFFVVTIVNLLFGLFAKANVDGSNDINSTSWSKCWDSIE